MSRPDATSPSQLFNTELVVMRDFLKILQQEEQALVAGEIDRLMPFVNEKTRLAASLGEFAGQRSRMLAAAALPANKQGMDKWLARLPATDPTRKIWQALVKTSAEAQTLNESNGKLIAMLMQHNQQSLNVLLAAANQASLYGPDGQTKSKGGGRLFGAA